MAADLQSDCELELALFCLLQLAHPLGQPCPAPAIQLVLDGLDRG